MSKDEGSSVNRRQLLAAAIAGGAAVAGCSNPTDQELPADSTTDGISEQTLAEAEKLFGLQHTDEERSQALSGTLLNNAFDEQIETLASRRAINIPYGAQPALTFDPRLLGVDYGAQQDQVSLFPETLAPLPDNPEDIAFASVKQQARWLTSGQISSRELTEIYLERIERYAERLECFVTVTADVARAQADQADRERATGQVRGPLHGIPYGVKDLLDTADIRTTWGAEPFKDRVPGTDGAVVRLLQAAGAVMLGKTTLGALAWGDVWFGGETRNPWNPKEGASGSSAGSGSATAAGLCAFAIGTETLGSIVSPSDRNGLAGLRPTFGRVSRAGAMALCWSLDKIGPMCRFAEDNALVLAAINGYDAEDAGSIRMGFNYDGGLSLNSLTIGYDPSWFEAEDVHDTDLTALEACRELGATMIEVNLPDLPIDEISPALGIEAAAAFEELTLTNQDDLLRRQIDNAWPNVLRKARYFSAVDYVQADRLRRMVMREAHDFFAQADVIIGPSFGNPMLSLTNYTGQPCLALRAGFEEITPRSLFDNPENDEDETLHRVPRSISLWCRLFNEGPLIAVARALETQLDVANERPDLS